MTILIAYSGAGASGQAQATPVFTNTANPGDLLMCFVTMGNGDNALPDIDAEGWELVASAVGGAGPYAIDNGPRISAIFIKLADGTETGGSSITVLNPGTGGNQRATYAYITRLTKTFSDWSILTTFGSDDGPVGHYEVTGPDNVGVSAVGALDMLWICSATRPDLSAETNPAITVPGCVMQALVQMRSTATTMGNDARHLTYRSTVQSGTQSAPATWECDFAAGDAGGATTFLRVREVDIPTGTVRAPIALASAHGAFPPSIFAGVVATGEPGYAQATAFGLTAQVLDQPVPPAPSGGRPPATGPMLGCPPDEYTVHVMERCVGTNRPGSGVPVAVFDDFDGISWGRSLNNVSKGSVSLPYGCCDFVDDLATWRHELTVFRSGDVVWQGPLVNITPSSDGLTLDGWDIAGWLARRVVHAELCYRLRCRDFNPDSRPTPPTQIAYDIAVDGFRGPFGFEDDPCGIEWTEVVEQSDYTIARRYRPGSAYSLSAMKRLAEQHIDFVTVGRRLIIMPKDYELGRTSLLTDEAFGSGVETPEDGTRVITRAYFKGDGVRATAGGKHGFYGLLEGLMEDTSVKDRQDAWQAARGVVMNARPPLRYVDIPSGATLSPEAPVTIAELVPGVTVPTVLESGCRSIGSDLRLTELSVRVSREAESVSISALSPRDANADISGLSLEG